MTKMPAPMIAPTPSAVSWKIPVCASGCARPSRGLLHQQVQRLGCQQICHSFGFSLSVYVVLMQLCSCALRDHTKYTGIPSSTMISPGHVYCGL